MPNLIKAKYPSIFTADQVRALDRMQAWYYDNESLEFCLAGYAGTGKTFIINYFLNHVVRTRSCVTAPTHKAVRVIEEMTGKTGRTLHNLHGLRPNISLETLDINNLKFDIMGTPHIRDYMLIVIDECSQINSGLFALNKTRATQYRVKILYVGDEAQLPPIGERVSRAFLVKDKVVLNTIVRQEEDNPLRDLLSILRLDVRHRTSKFVNHIRQNRVSLNEKGKGYITVTPGEFNDHINEHFLSEQFMNNLNYVRVAAWKNKTILAHNTHIRKLIVKDTTEIVNINDLFIGYRTVVDEFLTALIVNSEDYIVEAVEKAVDEFGFEIFKTRIRGMASRNSVGIRIVDHKSKTFGYFYNHLNNLHANAYYHKGGGARKWKPYMEFKAKYFTLTTIPLQDSDGTVRSYVKKDLDYGYGLTVHKLQGSTINTVFVDLEDMMYYTSRTTGKPVAVADIEHRNKLIYTALSRASDKAIILFNK